MPYNSFRNNSIVRRNLLNSFESNSGVSILDTSQTQTQEIYICKVATTTNILLDGSVTSIDDIAIVDGDIIAVWKQTDLTENGIYYANTDGFVRIDTDLLPIVVTINDGTLNKDKLLYLVSIDYEIGTSDIVYIGVANFELPDGDLNSLFRYNGTEWIKTTNTTLTDGNTDNKLSLLNNTYPELKRAVINVTELESTMIIESDPTAPTGGQLIYANTNESSESIDLIHENNDFISLYGTNNYRYVSLYNDSGEQLIIRSYKTPNATNINIQISDGTNVNFKVTNDGKIYTKAYPQIDTLGAAAGKVLTCVDSDGNTIWDDIPDAQIQTDYTQTDNTKADFLKNKPVGTHNGDMQVWDTTLGAWKNVFIYGLNVQTLSANIVLDDSSPENHVFSNSAARTVRLSGSVNRKFTIYAVGPAPLLIYHDGTLIDAISPTQFKTYIFDGTNWKIFDYSKYATESNFGGVQIATDTQFNSNVNDNDGILLMATINQINNRIPLLMPNIIPVTDSTGVLRNNLLLLYTSGESRFMTLATSGINGTTSEIDCSVESEYIRATVAKNTHAKFVVYSSFGYIEVISNQDAFKYKNINTGDYLFIVDADGVIYCIGIRINSASKGAGKVLTSDADGNGTWQTLPLATIDVSGQVEIATNTEFTDGTEKNGSKYLMPTVPQVKEAIPPQRYVSLGADVLLDTNNFDYAVFTLPVPSATYRYEMEINLFVEFANDTTDMQFYLVRSTEAYLSAIRGTITQTAQDGTLYPTNTKFWESGSDWVGANLLTLQTMSRNTYDDQYQLITLKAFLVPSNALNLQVIAVKNNGGQCKVKARSFGVVRGYN